MNNDVVTHINRKNKVAKFITESEIYKLNDRETKSHPSFLKNLYD